MRRGGPGDICIIIIVSPRIHIRAMQCVCKPEECRVRDLQDPVFEPALENDATKALLLPARLLLPDWSPNMWGNVAASQSPSWVLVGRR